MSEPIRRMLDALLEDLQAGLPIRLDNAARYRAEVDGYTIQFEGEDDLLHCSVERVDGGEVALEDAHRIVEPLFSVMPKGIVWFKPAEHSVHYYVGHDHFLQAHQQETPAADANPAP
ncbi:MAG: hypothetical protein WHS44_11325 [Fimbriimonadales bacterium]|nr:MAG: hypothetical protein KatS3mg018_0097 [Fimbriimonadales bacterium]